MCVWLCCIFVFFFVFKQKTAYEMRISDWSSDVCSSDLRRHSVSRREPANVLSYALKRLVTVVPTLLVIITVAFFMMRLAPGGPFDSDRALPPEIEKNIKAAYDLDKPLVEQYLLYMGRILQGDFGPSLKLRDFSVGELIASVAPASMEDRKSTRLNSSHSCASRMPSSA